MERFKTTSLGDVSLVLGMQVTRDRQNKTLTINQENYTKSILEKLAYLLYVSHVCVYAILFCSLCRSVYYFIGIFNCSTLDFASLYCIEL